MDVTEPCDDGRSDDDLYEDALVAMERGDYGPAAEAYIKWSRAAAAGGWPDDLPNSWSLDIYFWDELRADPMAFAEFVCAEAVHAQDASDESPWV